MINVRRGHKRGSIPADYVCSTETVIESDSLLDYKVWSFVRKIARDKLSHLFPSFSAINSLVSTEKVIPTSIGFTPILPHPITEFKSVFTVMVNFQDVLMQKNQKAGALWCDEGVYCIAKEIQLLFPDKFENIFLGLGGFHTEKIILACCGKLLKDIGARDIFVQNEIYGPTVTDETILKGKNYVLCREAIRNLSEAVERIKIEKFMNGWDDQLTALHELVKDLFVDPSLSENSEIRLTAEDVFRVKWGAVKEFVKSNVNDEYYSFKKSGEESSEMWQFWNIFNDEVLPILIDMTRSFREADWELHLKAVRKAIPLFFNCNRTNYCRWTPIYFEDCLNLKTKHPEIHKSFCEGDFVVHHTNRQASGMPMDQALEKEYNKTAKGPGGVIGITRQKESVAKWNLIKHEKKGFTNFIDNLCGLNTLDEYSLHHEFSSTVTKKDNHDVEVMKEYIEANCNLVKVGKLSNMVTGIQLPDVMSNSLLKCFETGDAYYDSYRQTVLVDKTKGIFDTIHRTHQRRGKKGKANNSSGEKVIDLTKLNSEFTRVVDIARSRNYNVKDLFTYEISDMPYFLCPDGNYLSKSNKSELQSLLKTRDILNVDFDNEPQRNRSILVIDFMAEARKIESRRKKFGFKTFGDALNDIWNTCWKKCKTADRIDFVFDCYKKDSIKALERERRNKSKDPLHLTISNMNQPLPIASEFERFWSLSENKIGLQQFFISWIMETYDGDKPIFLGGCHVGDVDKCFKVVNNDVINIPLLECSYDEADDRLMFHLNHAVRVENYSCAHVASRDTDIMVCLMYHQLTWRRYGLSEIWMHNSGNVSALHESLESIPDELIRVLPAIHALSGCDTTSKVGTKLQAYRAAQKDEYRALEKFGVIELDDEMNRVAEHFLLDCMSRTAQRSVDTFDELRYERYHKPGKFSVEKFPCSSNTLKAQIRWAFFQCNLWLGAATKPRPELDPTDYNYGRDENDFLYPLLKIEQYLPPDYPKPCKCLKCAKETVCPCRVMKICCSEFCKCKMDCKNPHK